MAPELRQIIDELPIPLDLPWSPELTRRDFPAALQKVDTHLMDHPDDLAARLWWVQCQSELGQVPATALSAPLEEILPKLRDANELYEGAVSVFLRVGCRLLEKKQTKLAVVLLDRAYEFARKGRSLPVEAREHIRASLLATLKQEQERAELKRESKPYLESLKKKVSEISEIKDQEDDVPSAGPQFPKKRSGRLSANSILEAALEERDHTPESSISSSISDVPTADQGSDRHTGAAILIILCGGLMIVLGLLFDKIFAPSPDTLETRLAINLLPGGLPSLVLPQLEFSATTAEASLDSASKKLEKIRKEGKEEGKPEPLAWSGPNPTPAPIPPPVVATDRPLSAQERQRLPEMDPEKLAHQVIQSLGASPEQNPIGSVVRGPDGRIYGPPPSDPSARALDGSQLHPVEVETLSSPKLYKVIAATAVFSAPSVIAQAVARLEPNAKIQVIARMGKWLELRSAGGRRGYIYSQDAAPSEAK